ncbi:hypothetical protein NE865_02022 [Phthorimaea operculella]|nr:hypothetical protein NE865_02022 [Phthorimaea operculella]
MAAEANADLLRELERCSQQLKDTLRENGELKSLYLQVRVKASFIIINKGSRASMAAEANADLLRELERCSQQLKDTLRENGELKSLYLQMAPKANADLLRELERCSQQLKDTLRENGELKSLYLQVCSARDAASRELRDMQSKIQQEKELYKDQEKDYVERLEKEKQHAEKLVAELNNAKEELEGANKRIQELQKEFNDKQKEFTDKLNKYLADEKNAMRKEHREVCEQCEKHLQHIRHLDEQLSKCSIKLATQESNEALMKELKGKAEFFQQYIIDRFKKLSEQRSVGTNTEGEEPPPATEPTSAPAPNTPAIERLVQDCDEALAAKLSEQRSVGTNTEGEVLPPATEPSSAPAPNTPAIERLVQDCDEALAAKTVLMMKEKAIRDQLAEKYTLEMKTAEMNCARKLKEMENEHLNGITKLKELLERKAKEVETLKEFILSERAKVTQVLESKENEISVLIKEHNEIQAECQQAKESVVEWRLKAERYKDKLSRMSSVEDLLKLEREDWHQKTSSSARELQMLKNKIGEVQAKLAHVEQKYEKLKEEHSMLMEKYKNCKKTVFTYKDYMAKKDAHVTNEMNRIQDEYRKIFMRMQNQINYHVNCRIQEERNQGKGAPARRHEDTTAAFITQVSTHTVILRYRSNCRIQERNQGKGAPARRHEDTTAAFITQVSTHTVILRYRSNCRIQERNQGKGAPARRQRDTTAAFITQVSTHTVILRYRSNCRIQERNQGKGAPARRHEIFSFQNRSK